jgi:hypothetical protein
LLAIRQNSSKNNSLHSRRESPCEGFVETGEIAYKQEGREGSGQKGGPNASHILIPNRPFFLPSGIAAAGRRWMVLTIVDSRNVSSFHREDPRDG